jgi:hypothetical protein
MYSGVYLLLLIIGQYAINLELTKSMCGTIQYDTALFITLIPWVFIFGLLYAVLSLFPGWIIPFSNTFGYGVTKLMGINTVLTNILKPKGEETEGMLWKIYSDKSLLINSISQDDFENFWNSSLGSVINTDATDLDENKIKFKNLIRLKDIIGEYIWYLLTGALVTSVSFNYVVNKGCKQSVKEMEKRRATFLNDLEEKKKNTQDPKVYKSLE